MRTGTGFIRHEALAALGVEHGFGTRRAPEVSQECVIPRQVHGRRILRITARPAGDPPEADGVVTATPHLAVAVVTADCVPVLAACAGGGAVAAIHAGWRGLAAGVVEAGAAALLEIGGGRPGRRAAVVGPHIGPCCYEVDAPVLEALAHRFGDRVLEQGVHPTRPAHARVDLGRLARHALLRAGFGPDEVFEVDGACTRCDPARFHSWRRDGSRAGRMPHFVAARGDAGALDRSSRPA